MDEECWRKWLNWLVDNRVACMVKGGVGTASLFRFQVLMELDHYKNHPENCYLFSVGQPSKDVFSSALVKEIRILSGHAEIILKG